jgi:hypothetical protein
MVQSGSGAKTVSYPMDTEGSFSKVKRLVREAHHLPPASAEVNETCICTSPIRLHGVVLSSSTGTTLSFPTIVFADYFSLLLDTNLSQ